MSQTTPPVSGEPATTLGVPTTAEDPGQLSARLADPSTPGANYVDLRETASPAPHPSHPPEHSHPRYWVGLSGEVVATEVDQPRPGANPELRRARRRYSAAVEAVRRHYRVALSTDLFATPGTFVGDAFFVHDSAAEPVVRWVDGDGGVHDGYQLVEGAPRWDPATAAARRRVLAAQPGTGALVRTGG